jgi:hypothetical protein
VSTKILPGIYLYQLLHVLLDRKKISHDFVNNTIRTSHKKMKIKEGTVKVTFFHEPSKI